MIKVQKSPLNDLNLWEGRWVDGGGGVCLTNITTKQNRLELHVKVCFAWIKSKVSSVNVNEISKIVNKHLQDQTTETIIRASGVPLCYIT